MSDAQEVQPEAEYEALLRFVYVCPVGILQFTPDGAVQMANPLAAQLLMPVVATRQMDNFFTIFQGCAPELRNLADSFNRPRGTICENHRIFLGQTDPMAPRVLNCTVLKVDPDRLMAVISDVSTQVAQERRLKQAESWFAALLTGVNDFAIVSLDADGRIDSWSDSAKRQTGFADTEALGHTMQMLLPEDEARWHAFEQTQFARRDGWHLDEGWRRRKDGSRYWCQSLVSALKEEFGKVVGFAVVLRDVSEHRRQTSDLARLLTTDHLTEVTNRARFFEIAETEEARYRRYGQALSAVMLDIDHFKNVNDAHGHAAGDAVLKAFAACCQAAVRSIDTLARLGGEEFAILMPGTPLEEAKIVAERIRSRVEALEIDGAGHAVRITASLGCATMGEGIDSAEKLIEAADEALYEAKRTGRNRVVVKASLKAVA